MEFKGTKGPWFLSNNDSSGKTEKPIIRGEGRMVCMLPPISPDNEANAKLIAAAPELLEALKYARRFMDKEQYDLAYIDKVLKKATE